MKKALITGASGGIGLATAKELAKESYQLTLVARREDKLQAIIKDLPGEGHQYLVADLSSEGGIEKISAHLLSNRYQVLINNAGIGIYGRFEAIPIEKQISMMKLNCDAVTRLSFAYLQNAEKGDALINVASTLASTSFASAATYAGTKGFVLRMSESLWYEFRKKGVYVNALCPGVTTTDFHTTAGENDENFPDAIKQTPEQVAKELVNALKKRKKPMVVSGGMNRMMLFGHRFLSRSTIVKMMGGFSPILKG